MSLWIDQPVTCPKCRQSSDRRLWPSINAHANPELREALLNQELLRFVCRTCGAKIDLCYPILYHDMERKFMVQCITPPEPPTYEDLKQQIPEFEEIIQSYRLRVVAEPHRLREKIVVFEAGMDDRVVEVFKAYMRHIDRKSRFRPGSEVYYGGVIDGEKGPEIVLVELASGHAANITFPSQKYLNVHNNVIGLIEAVERPEETERWRRIDSDWARVLLHHR